MATLGGRLKRREKLSGRLADALAWLYLGSASAKRFWDDGTKDEDIPFLAWICAFRSMRSTTSSPSSRDVIDGQVA